MGLKKAIEAEIKAAESAARADGFADAQERAAKLVQNFKWSDDDDSDLTELLAIKIRWLKPQ